MFEKKKSVITKIKLNTPTYKNTAVDDISFINFFYGNNGTGKTTIAEEINKNENLKINPTLNFEDYSIFSYGMDFVRANFSLKDKLKAIYTLGSSNVDAQSKIDSLRVEIKTLKSDLTKEQEILDAINTAIKTEHTAKVELFWKKTASERAFFSNYVQGLKTNKESLFTKILSVYNDNPGKQEIIFEDLKKKLELAYSSESTEYPLIGIAKPQLPTDNGLLQTTLTTSDSTEYAHFVKALNNIRWIKEGHDNYHTDDNLCPYCRQSLPFDFEEQFASCFNDEYQNAIKQLTIFRNNYEIALSSYINKLKNLLGNTLPSLDFSEFNIAVDMLERKYKENLNRIDEKIKSPELKTTLNDVSTDIESIEKIISSFNAAINEHKRILENRKKAKRECGNEIYKYLVNIFRDDIESYLNIKNKQEKNLSEHNKYVEAINANIRNKDAEVHRLLTNVISAETTVRTINTMIKDSGFQGFKLLWDSKDKGSYQVVYTHKDEHDNYVPATKLSEGERNFIAFLYFYHMVVNTDENASTKKRIVIIDDPVSSMDNQSLFIVSSLVKNLIDRCINASTIDDLNVIKENNIAQMFILTHNVYFHSSITPEYESNFSAVNFYHIKKTGNNSKLELRTTKKSDGTFINNNPIKNSYAALWHELDEAETSISACNIIHRILGYYFINLCGYTNKSLEQKMLVDNSSRFLKDENGNETQERYNLVRGFLEYLGHSQNVVGNEVYYVDSCDVQTCKETLQLIFNVMGQSQHYDMMMKSLK